ncbi:unnamed protein product [Nesidiocoris tenuis]|uniref:Uncharacterized protein n=1 Tax=Nesidiocoris tenuis TaxID=355587 RepID=A0A6H5GK71_9HEMI|nr:unnamed protein product [Nesidiocoris tenuis]
MKKKEKKSWRKKSEDYEKKQEKKDELLEADEGFRSASTLCRSRRRYQTTVEIRIRKGRRVKYRSSFDVNGRLTSLQRTDELAQFVMIAGAAIKCYAGTCQIVPLFAKGQFRN